MTTPSRTHDNSFNTGTGIALGAAFGILFGMLFDNLGLGFVLGISLGLIAGSVFEARIGDSDKPTSNAPRSEVDS